MKVDLKAAQNYGEALFAAAKSQGVVEQLWHEGRELRQASLMVPGFAVKFFAPHIPTEDKVAFVRKTLEGRITPLLLNFLLLLLRRGRAEVYGPSLEHFHTLAMRELGISEGTVTTAVPLGDDQRTRVQAALEQTTRLKLKIDWKVDPSIIGGVVFLAGDLLIDNSLRSQLDRIGEKFLAARLN